MLQAMLDCQAELCALLGVPPGLRGVQEASIGMVKEAAELIEEVHPGSRAWRRVDYEAADKEAIDVLLYLLEYFVLRGYDAEEILQMYYAKAEVVAHRQTTKAAADKEEYIQQDEVLSNGDYEVENGIFQEQARHKAVVIAISGENSVDLLRAFCDSGFDGMTDEEADEYHRKVMDEAIGPDCPPYVQGSGP